MDVNPLALLLVLWLAFVIFRVAFIVFGRGRVAGHRYRRIKAWLTSRHGLRFGKDTDPGAIRMQLQSILERERMRLKADFESRPEYYEAERKKKRWRRPFDVDKRLAGFKAFIDRQDYSVLTD
jgi:hypothetical protein